MRRETCPHTPSSSAYACQSEQSAQQVSRACAGLQDTRAGRREGTDHVGSVQPLGTCFGVVAHMQIPLQFLWGYWDSLTPQPPFRAAVIQTTSAGGTRAAQAIQIPQSKPIQVRKPNPERSFHSLLEQWLPWKTGLQDCPDYIS